MLAYTWSAYLAATETDWLPRVGKHPKISTLEATHTSQAATFICDINLHSVHALLQRFGLFRTLQETQTWRHFSQQKKNKKKILLSHDFFPIKHTFHGSFPTRKQKRNNLENPGRPVMISFFSSSKNFPELREPCSNFFPLSLVCLFSRECHRETESWFSTNSTPRSPPTGKTDWLPLDELEKLYKRVRVYSCGTRVVILQRASFRSHCLSVSGEENVGGKSSLTRAVLFKFLTESERDKCYHGFYLDTYPWRRVARFWFKSISVLFQG